MTYLAIFALITDSFFWRILIDDKIRSVYAFSTNRFLIRNVYRRQKLVSSWQNWDFLQIVLDFRYVLADIPRQIGTFSADRFLFLRAVR